MICIFVCNRPLLSLVFVVVQACVYLEDPRPANDRTAEVPREMKLSVLRWDCCPEVPPPPRAPLHARGGVAAAGGVFGEIGDRGRGNVNSKRNGAKESAFSPWGNEQ